MSSGGGKATDIKQLFSVCVENPVGAHHHGVGARARSCVSVCVCVCVCGYVGGEGVGGWGGGGGWGVYVSPSSAMASLSDTLSVKDVVNQSLRACVCASYSFLYCCLELVRDLRVF